MTNQETPQNPDPNDAPDWTPAADATTTSPTGASESTSSDETPLATSAPGVSEPQSSSHRRWLIPVGIAAGALTIGLLGGVAGATIADDDHGGPEFGERGHGEFGPFGDDDGDHDFDRDGDYPDDDDMPGGVPSTEAPSDGQTES